MTTLQFFKLFKDSVVYTDTTNSIIVNRNMRQYSITNIYFDSVGNDFHGITIDVNDIDAGVISTWRWIYDDIKDNFVDEYDNSNILMLFKNDNNSILLTEQNSNIGINALLILPMSDRPSWFVEMESLTAPPEMMSNNVSSGIVYQDINSRIKLGDGYYDWDFNFPNNPEDKTTYRLPIQISENGNKLEISTILTLILEDSTVIPPQDIGQAPGNFFIYDEIN